MSYTSEIADALGEVIALDSVTAAYSATVSGGTLYSFTARRNRGELRTDAMRNVGYQPEGELMLTATAAALGANVPVVNGIITLAGRAYQIMSLRQDAAGWLFHASQTT
jgi:hypothetical protein